MNQRGDTIDTDHTYFAQLTTDHLEAIPGDDKRLWPAGTVVLVYGFDSSDAFVEVAPAYQEAVATYLRIPLVDLTRLCDICEERRALTMAQDCQAHLCTVCAQDEPQLASASDM